MRALIQYESGIRKLKVADIPLPEMQKDQVRVKVIYSGICGTDLHIYQGDESYPTNPPIVIGHEFSGIIEEIGSEVPRHFLGKKVVSETYYTTCGQCFFCQSGKKNLCPERKSIGSSANGAMGEYIAVPSKNIHFLGEKISLKEAAMTEPLACCAQAVLEMGRIKAGDRVMVIGPGSIGLICAQIAIAEGAHVLVTGMKKDQKRLELALEFGAKRIHVQEDSKEEELKRFFEPYGADHVLECSGSEKGIQMGLEFIRKGGDYIQVGLTGKPIQMDMNKITLKELCLRGTFAQKTKWWIRALELIESGKVQLNPLISEVFPLENWEKAFEAALAGEGLKYLLTPLKEENRISG